MQLTLILISASVAQAVHAEAATEMPFKYSDEWSLVSAPPPAGPYQPVNIDPRVPGPGTIPQVPMAIPRLQATQEPPEVSDIQADAAAGGQAAADLREDITRAASDAPAMPPVPGHYQPVMPLAGEETAVETVAGELPPEAGEPAPEAGPAAGTGALDAPVTAAVPGPDIDQAGAAPVQEPVSEPPMTAEQAPAPVQEPVPESTMTAEQVPAPALPATAETGTDQPVAGTGQLAETPTAATPAEDAFAAGEEVQTTTVMEEEPAIAATADEPVPGPVMTEAPAASPVTPADQLQQAQEDVPAPPVARGLPGMPVPEQPATAMQQQPYEPAQPGFYDRLVPPAAGHISRQPPIATPAPAEPLREQPAERAPSTGYYGYGRSVPTPGYGYPRQGYQSYPSQGYQSYQYQSGRPGYRNMPPYGYGYPQMQEGTGEPQDVPPPTVYDPMQYPRTPMQGYR
jgi:hypothetical protein